MGYEPKTSIHIEILIESIISGENKWTPTQLSQVENILENWREDIEDQKENDLWRMGYL